MQGGKKRTTKARRRGWGKIVGMDGMSRLYSIGADYRTAAGRRLIEAAAGSAADKLRQLRRQQGLAPEAALVATCNRAEIYCITDRPGQVADFLAGGEGGGLFRFCAADAVRRAFSVASGLESQIIGENEIAGQIKQAAQIARDSGAAGAVINRLMEKSLAAAKAVRAQTNIGGHSMSYGGLAARAAAGIFPDFRQLSVLIVGAGAMSRTAAAIFADRGAARIAVAGRNLQKAEALAATFGGDAFALNLLPEKLAAFDVVVAAAASPLPLIGKGAAERALARRKRRPMMFADLGAPRNLEAEIADLPDAFVYTLAQLGEQAERSQIARQQAAAMSKGIIDRHVDDFCKWWRERMRREQLLAAGGMPMPDGAVLIKGD